MIMMMKSHINFELIIDGTVIKQVNICKYLGITIDDKLSWQDHIDFVYNKVVRFLAFLPARSSKQCPCYGNVSGWLAVCLSQPVLYQND